MIFGFFRKVKRLLFLFFIASILLIAYIISSVFKGEININTDFITNSTNPDVMAATETIEKFKGSHSVESVRLLLKSLILQAENFASTHTSIPTVYIDYYNISTNEHDVSEAHYTLDYPDSLDEYIASLNNMLNTLNPNATYNIDFSYIDGVINEVLINGQVD